MLTPIDGNQSTYTAMKKIALITGVTGLVGRELLDIILADNYYKSVIVVTRRPLNFKDNRITEIVTDFDHLDMIAGQLDAHDHYCCLGTTIKKAGSKENFRKVDYDYPIKHAQIAAKGSHFERFLIVTALGSNASSPLFYNKIKGQVEETLKDMHLPSLQIFQPSLLLGSRDEFRLGEEVAKFFTTILSFFIVRANKFWSIHGRDVARAMYHVAKDEMVGTYTYKPAAMLKLSHPSR